MKLEKADLSFQRRRYFSDNCSLFLCPECSKNTQEKECQIVLFISVNDEIDNYIVDIKGAYFCNDCPVVIFDVEKISDEIEKRFNDVNANIDYHIAGFVDIDDIPIEKRNKDIGSEENPVPIVRFLPPLKKQQRILSNKPSQNAQCPCGSGKKYKRCCGK